MKLYYARPSKAEDKVTIQVDREAYDYMRQLTVWPSWSHWSLLLEEIRDQVTAYDRANGVR